MEGEAAAGVAHAAAGAGNLSDLAALLAAAVIAVPLFKRLGLGSVLGYLAAGVVVGPFGFGLFDQPEEIVHTAELGVVFLLFVIGLEMRPSRLWAMRRDLFGLGVAQVLFCGALLTCAAALAGYSLTVAFVAASGFVLTSTAIVLQILDERGDTTSPYGQKIVAILLLEDLAIVPLLAVVAVITPGEHAAARPFWLQAVTAAVAIAAVIFAGRYVLNPIFRILAATRAREIMTAAALLVVIGAALAIQAGGLSMAMGAFIAGVVLSESAFRHQLEADIEPFRGLLLGLFFLGVGMSLDLSIVASDWPLILGVLAVFMVLKSGGIYLVARLFKSNHVDSLKRALLMAQGGEFAFVLYTNAGGAGLLDERTLAILTAAVILSMAITPLAPLAFRLFDRQDVSLDGVERADGLQGAALMIGFGRFGQIAAQSLLARGVDTAIIDIDPDMIRSAARFGFKIYYGDGTRLDVLRAAGAGSARIIVVAIDNRDSATRIVEVVKEEFPMALLFVRSYDRGHAITLAQLGTDYEIRETFESAMALGEAALVGLGFTAEEAAETKAEVRRRDADRLRIQIAENSVTAGRDFIVRAPVPTPLTPVKRETKPLTEETAKVSSEPRGTADAPPSDRQPVS